MEIQIVFGFDNLAFFDQQQHDIIGVMRIDIQQIGDIAKIRRLKAALMIEVEDFLAYFRLVGAQGHPVVAEVVKPVRKKIRIKKRRVV